MDVYAAAAKFIMENLKSIIEDEDYTIQNFMYEGEHNKLTKCLAELLNIHSDDQLIKLRNFVIDLRNEFDDCNLSLIFFDFTSCRESITHLDNVFVCRDTYNVVTLCPSCCDAYKDKISCSGTEFTFQTKFSDDRYFAGSMEVKVDYTVMSKKDYMIMKLNKLFS